MNSKIKLKVGEKELEYEKGVLLQEIAASVQDEYEDTILMAEYNGKLSELFISCYDDGTVKFLTISDKNGRRAYRRSLVFLMQKAIDRLFDEWMDVRVMYPFASGYYCLPPTNEQGEKVEVTEEFLTNLRAEMNKLIEEDIPITKSVMKTKDAAKMFRHEGLFAKEKLLWYRASSNINIYELDGLHDYFYGYMVPSTGVLSTFDLVKYSEGFILQFPKTGHNEIEAMDDSPKLFDVFCKSSEWSDAMGIPTVGALNDVIASGKTTDLVLSQEALMEERIGTLAKEIVSDRNRKFVMIAGPSSSGKTTFSHRLSVQLLARGVKTHPIPLDMYYKNRDQMPLDEFGQKDFEALEGLDIERFNEDMNALLKGQDVELPIFNFKIGRREDKGRLLSIGKDDVLVIEGIHGLNDRLSYSLPAESKYRIYISALTQLTIDEHNPMSTTDGRLIRRIVRDARTRGTEAAGTIAMWDSVRRGEEKNIFPFQEKADVLFNSALIYEMAVLKLYAEPLLYGIHSDDPVYAEAKRLKKLLTYFLPMPTEAIAQNSLIREFIGGSIYKV